jgi:hypothetical protein
VKKKTQTFTFDKEHELDIKFVYSTRENGIKTLNLHHVRKIAFLGKEVSIYNFSDERNGLHKHTRYVKQIQDIQILNNCANLELYRKIHFVKERQKKSVVKKWRNR